MTAATLAEVHCQAFTDSRAWTEQEFSDLLSSDLCFWTGDSRGFALGRVISDEVELLTLAVLPKFQSSGVGRELLGKFHQNASERGATSAFLEVATTNKRAVNLYISNGYTKVGTRSAYYFLNDGRKVDALIFHREL
ncbi:N-acetyltransferase [Cognatishimia sp. WU-CL00825]|uniref:GNAT family N-acetyltransferase n=1 Tax=Cognatishimia sp. WU-CL00825 TaxID=3127658 RepID=UPI003102FF08